MLMPVVATVRQEDFGILVRCAFQICESHAWNRYARMNVHDRRWVARLAVPTATVGPRFGQRCCRRQHAPPSEKN